MVCLSVDQWQYYKYVWCVRSGVASCTFLIVLYLCVYAGAGCMRCIGLTSVYFYASSLQNLAVSPEIYSLHSIYVERSW